MKNILEKDLVPGKIYRHHVSGNKMKFLSRNSANTSIIFIHITGLYKGIDAAKFEPNYEWHEYYEDRIKFGRT